MKSDCLCTREPTLRRALGIAVAVLAISLPQGEARGADEEQAPQESMEEEVLSTPSTFEAPKGDPRVLSVDSRPAGARVFVDGEDRGKTPLELKGLPEGTHEVILYLAGFGAYRQVLEGQGGKIFVDLESEKGLGMGLVSVVTDPPDARVDVDGRRVGLSPLEVPLEAGRHTVRLSKAGFKDVDQSIDVEAGGGQEFKAKLSPRDGSLLVISSPTGAEVLLDGKSVGKTTEPLRVQDVPPGTHVVRVTKDEYRPWEKADVRVRSDETATILAALLPERDYAWVRLFTDPIDVNVWLDGELVGVAGADGLGFKTNKGAHALRLEADPATQPGFQPLRITVNFTEDQVDYRQSPLRLAAVNPNFSQAQALIERGQLAEALSFLGRVPPDHASYGEARLQMVELLSQLDRKREIPAELESLLQRPEYRGNPILNMALAYWNLTVARDAPDSQAVQMLGRALDALDRAVQAVELFPAEQRDVLMLKTHYYAGIACEILFNLTAERKYVTKGNQAWEIFFARLELSPKVLEGAWVEKARNHRRTLEFLGKKLGG